MCSSKPFTSLHEALIRAQAATQDGMPLAGEGCWEGVLKRFQAKAAELRNKVEENIDANLETDDEAELDAELDAAYNGVKLSAADCRDMVEGIKDRRLNIMGVQFRTVIIMIRDEYAEWKKVRTALRIWGASHAGP